ncbi:hypothetical protein K737_301171 [Holospora undulata HU1]|uniref:Uncharacterized protein n=2 Tax=Holospora TaxID=44747 RepID=A0A061JGN6_9PROT|nr:hypothetical protein K737_301171 [Holospora undulata HU1]GAJ46726.1 hypothetical protein HE1_01065 [Holospora elegans E1]
MNTTNNLGLAESYYTAMLAKDFDKMAGYLHENVHFIGLFSPNLIRACW